MNIKILRLGKFGNCIIKILNSIQIALFYKYNIIIPVHPLFNTTYIKINNAVDINEPCITDPNEFFYPSKINDIDRKLFHMNHDKAIEILQAIFKYPNGTIKIEDNDLLIHVRGDDLFGDIVHPGYIPSPLIYFKDIISNKNWNNIYLVSKDKKNPVVNELLSIYPKIIYISGKLEDDIYYILQAKNVVIDVGTFIPSILLLSKNIKTIYYNRDCYIKPILKEINYIYYNYNDYLNIQHPWKCSDTQIKNILEYIK